MKSVERMPTAKNIPELNGNIEGLKRHSFACGFDPESNLSTNARKLRTWLLHTVASSSRHYTKARELVQLQDNADQSRDGGAVFHILDVSEQIEDCVMATFRACMAIGRLDSCESAQEFSNQFSESIQSLRSIRNQFDHMYGQVTSGETGGGPILIVFGEEGRAIRFRELSMKTASLHALIDGAYRVVAGLHPAFNANSAKEAGGPLTITGSMMAIDADGTQRENR